MFVARINVPVELPPYFQAVARRSIPERLFGRAGKMEVQEPPEKVTYREWVFLRVRSQLDNLLHRDLLGALVLSPLQ